MYCSSETIWKSTPSTGASPVEQTWMSALLNGFGKNTLDHIRYNAFVENEKDFVSKSVQELTPSSSRKTQAHKPEDRIAKLLFLKNKEQNRGIKPDFATSSTKCPATDLEKHPGGAASQTLHTYRDVGRSTWDQYWNAACKIQLAVEVLWCCQPESYCRDPPWKLKGCWSVDFSLAAEIHTQPSIQEGNATSRTQALSFWHPQPGVLTLH